MQALFHITGGLGKHVAATSVINSYKFKFPDEEIIVSSAYPDVFEKNPNVKESLDINNLQYFYKNYINKKDVKIFAQEPYREASHISKQKHLIQTWCEMVGTEQYFQPSLNIGFREHEIISRQFISDKPILIFQPFGGTNPNLPYNWARDIHPSVAQSIVNMLADKYNILHICNSYHPVLNNCHRIDNRLSFGELVSLVGISDKRFLIDSSIQHIAAAIGKPSIVVWNVTSPKLFGYNTHDNIISPVDYGDGHRKSYLFDYEIAGIPAECPVSNYMDMFDMDQILDSIKYLLDDDK